MTDTEWASHPYYDTPEDEHEDHRDYHDGPTDDDNEWDKVYRNLTTFSSKWAVYKIALDD